MSRARTAIIKRRTFLRFIQDDPITVRLERRVETTTAAGGKKLGAPVLLPYQTFRLVPASNRQTQRGETSEGDVEKASMNLVGPHTNDVRKDDRFEYNGVWYRIISVDLDDEFRKAAGCVEHGQP